MTDHADQHMGGLSHAGPPRIQFNWLERRWPLLLGLVCVVALAIRVAYVFLYRYPARVAGDPYHYHHGANLLVDGKGFIAPFAYYVEGRILQTAQHPPLYTVVLAIPSALGLRSFLAHQLWSCLIGVVTVALAGVPGRRLAGPRAGLIAATLGAVYPNLWMFDGSVAAETLSGLLVVVTLLSAYRLWDNPSLPRAAIVGVSAALAALTRAEAVLLLPLIVLPWVLGARVEARGRAALAVVAGVATTSLLAPWLVFNFSRFRHPVLVASSFDLTLVQGNCDVTYYGQAIGYYSGGCIPEVPRPRRDETDDAVYFRQVATQYIKDNAGRVPFVVFARIGRTFAFYHPHEQIKIDAYVDAREYELARLGLAMYVGLVAATIPGALWLRRHGVPLSPMLAVIVTAVIAVALTFGQTRYRASTEPVFVLLAAVGANAGIDRISQRRRAQKQSVGVRTGTAQLPQSRPTSEPGDDTGRQVEHA